MKALVKKYPEKGIWMEDVNMPEFGDNEVLIKIKKTSICGTDIHIYNWDDWAQNTIKTPMTIGHEYVGKIVDFGKNVSNVKKGDIVSGEGHIVCGECHHCLNEQQHLCPNTYGVGVNRDGAFAEYLVIPSSNVWHCDPEINEELFSVFDPLGNAVHTALSYDLVGEDVLVTGAGPIGIMAAAVAKKAGARKVVITDINDYRLNLAKKMGLKYAYNTSNVSLTDICCEIGIKNGFGVGLEMSGSKIAFNDMLDNMANGGKISLLAILPKDATIDWNKVVFKGLFIKGIYGREMYRTWFKMSALLQSGLDINPIVTHRFKVDDFQEAFEIMASGNSGKIILDWE
ncbi:MAG: L-threonine 3-dehydrogenase [Bacilli bacterium]